MSMGAVSFLFLASSRHFRGARGLDPIETRERRLRLFEQAVCLFVEPPHLAGSRSALAEKLADFAVHLVPCLAGMTSVDDLGAELARGLVVGFGMLAEPFQQNARERVLAPV